MHQEQALSEEDLALAKAVAQQAGIAIANARLYAEAAEERQKTEIVLRSVGDGVCTTDRELTLLSLNPAAERLLDWQEHEAIGRHCKAVLQCHDADEEPSCETACPLILAMREQRYEYSRLGALFVHSRSGQRIPIWGVAGPLTDPAGAVLGGVLAFRDASYEAEMERLQSEFMSMISHEVRSPLTNLKAAAQTITRLGGEQDDETRANLARIIAEQCDQLDRLVQRVEDTTQLEAGRLDLRLAPLCLPPLVRDVIQLLQLRDSQRTFDVVTTDEAASWVMGDADKISMVLNNLLDNAVKYSRSQGTITVKLSQWDQDQVLVSVIDEGPSIPTDQRDRIFQRFYRIDNTDARSVYGLGLGLYVARELITAMGGQIWVDGVGGPGNRFCFTLPRSRESTAP
jgi:PAS domain S-box-containing protein